MPVRHRFTNARRARSAREVKQSGGTWSSLQKRPTPCDKYRKAFAILLEMNRQFRSKSYERGKGRLTTAAVGIGRDHGAEPVACCGFGIGAPTAGGTGSLRI